MKPIITVLLIFAVVSAYPQEKKLKELFKRDMDTVAYYYKAMYAVSPFDKEEEIPDSLKKFVEGKLYSGSVEMSGSEMVYYFEQTLYFKLAEVLENRNYERFDPVGYLETKIKFEVVSSRDNKIKIIQYYNNDGGTMHGLYSLTLITDKQGKKRVVCNEDAGVNAHAYQVSLLNTSDTADFYLVLEGMKACSSCIYEGGYVITIKKDTVYNYSPVFYVSGEFQQGFGIEYRFNDYNHNSVWFDSVTRSIHYENTDIDVRDENEIPLMRKGQYVFNGKFFVHVEEKIPEEWLEEYKGKNEEE